MQYLRVITSTATYRTSNARIIVKTGTSRRKLFTNIQGKETWLNYEQPLYLLKITLLAPNWSIVGGGTAPTIQFMHDILRRQSYTEIQHEIRRFNTFATYPYLLHDIELSTHTNILIRFTNPTTKSEAEVKGSSNHADGQIITHNIQANCGGVIEAT